MVAHLLALGPAMYQVQYLQSLLCLQRSLQADQLATSFVTVASLGVIVVTVTLLFGHTNSEPRNNIY